MRYFFNNALYRAFSISTRCYGKFKSVRGLVSMPFIGLLPFLHLAKAAASLMMDACQCPLSGFLHFYVVRTSVAGQRYGLCQCPLSGFLHLNDIMDREAVYCVNALYRAFSISTGKFSQRNFKNKKVSMPFIGLSPFLRSPLGTP